MKDKMLLTLLLMGVLLIGAAVLFVEYQDTPIRAVKSGDLIALARSIVRNEDHVQASELAAWMIAGKKDLLVIDVRSADEYAAGHIESAQNIPLPELFQNGTIKELPKDRSIVLYSNGTANAAQAAVVLRGADRQAYSLMGGYNYWQEYTRNPELAGEADEDLLQAIKRKAIAWHFSDEYRAAGGLPLQQLQPVSWSTDATQVAAPGVYHRWLATYEARARGPQPVAAVAPSAPQPAMTPPAPSATEAPAAAAETQLIVEQGC